MDQQQHLAAALVAVGDAVAVQVEKLHFIHVISPLRFRLLVGNFERAPLPRDGQRFGDDALLALPRVTVGVTRSAAGIRGHVHTD